MTMVFTRKAAWSNMENFRTAMATERNSVLEQTNTTTTKKQHPRRDNAFFFFLVSLPGV